MPNETETVTNTDSVSNNFDSVSKPYIAVIVQKVRRKFQLEYGSTIEDFLDSIYMAGVDFAENGIAEHAQSIERSYKMLQLVDSSVELLRTKHKYGETYYWILYYSFLSPQQFRSAEEIIEQLSPHIKNIAIVHITVSEKKPLTRSLQSYGDILPVKA